MNWQKLKRAFLDDIVAWAETQPWCQSMANCDQDAQWHSEGDVWTHTKMVCQQLTELEQWPSLADDERTVLIFTALLHDAAKPITSQTDAETGRITSPNHAVKGELPQWDEKAEEMIRWLQDRWSTWPKTRIDPAKLPIPKVLYDLRHMAHWFVPFQRPLSGEQEPPP